MYSLSGRPDLETAGANWADVNETFSNAVVDGNLCTAPAWPGLSILLNTSSG